MLADFIFKYTPIFLSTLSPNLSVSNIEFGKYMCKITILMHSKNQW